MGGNPQRAGVVARTALHGATEPGQNRFMPHRDDAAPAAPGAPALTVAAVAARLGVAPATLRTWDRRYGLGPSERLAGSHRRYGSEDVARLVVMRRLTLDGVAPSEAARVARATPASELGTVDGALAAVVHLDPRTETDGRHTGPVTVTAVVDAALGMDAGRCRRILAAGLSDGAEQWWTELVSPARAAIAARTVLARPGDDAAALLESAALAVLRKRPGAAPELAERPQDMVLLAPAGDGTGRLALHALAAALVERGAGARVVTGPVDARHLVELCTMVRPAALVVLSDRARADLTLVADVHAALEDLDIFAGTVDDAAARSLPLHRMVQRARTFAGLLHEVTAVTGVITPGLAPLDR